MKIKKKKPLFVIQSGDGCVKVLKCLFSSHSDVEFLAAEESLFPPETEIKKISGILQETLRKFDYKNDPLIFSLPRSMVTCRYLKIPSHAPGEIEKIAALQAWRYLPYPPEELITGFEVIRIDDEGYSHISLVILHKDVINHYVEMVQSLRPEELTIALSTYGLCNIYNLLKPAENSPAMVVGIDSLQAEAAVVSGGKVILSRSFKLPSEGPLRKDAVREEINKTREAYIKETSMPSAARTFFIVKNNASVDFDGMETLSFLDKVNVSGHAAEKINASKGSFAGLIGLGLVKLPPSLNLLPADIKRNMAHKAIKKEYARLAAVLAAAFLFWVLGSVKSIDNKERYLNRIDLEISKVAKEAKPLEQARKRIQFMQERNQKKPAVLKALAELYKIIPAEIVLISFNYAENTDISFRGQAAELNSVFSFVSRIASSAVFKDLNPRIKYATQKKTSSGEVIDFEVTCSRK